MRELNIINELLTTSNYLSLEYFMNKYSISKRTLQNEFSYLANISKDKGFHLIQKRGRGYLLEIEDKVRFDRFITELNLIASRPKVSAENIVAYVTLNDCYVTMDNLIGLFKTSKSTIKSYNGEVDEYLKGYNLKMERRAHYGIRIEASLKKRRNLLVDLYIKNNKIIKTTIDNDIHEGFEEVRNYLIDTLRKQELVINYTELTQLVDWLKVTIYINIKSNIPICEECDMELVNIINKCFKVGISLDDINEFENLIKSKSRACTKGSNNLELLEQEISNFFIGIDKCNKTHFNDDKEFKKLLISHVIALINRLNFKISYTNPIIDELSIKYPMIFNIAIAFGDMLKEKYGVYASKDEIGFIATYFILHIEKETIEKLNKYNKISIVCSSGGGSAQLIKLKIENLFSYSSIKTFSVLQMKELEEYNPDIIFSIANLNNMNINAPIIYIKELLDDYDILNIKQIVMFEKFDEAYVDKTKEYYLKKFFDPMYFSIDEESQDYIECLKTMSQKIESCGIGGDNYSDYILKRENFASTIYLNGIAIPHPIEMQANKDLISVKIFKKPIMYNGKKVSIIFMISLKKDNLGFHKGITNDLFEIMNNLEMVQAILKVSSFKEFIAQINR